MSKTIAGTPLTFCYKTKATSIICVHHVYKEVWDVAIVEMLEAASDDLEDVKEYDKYAAGLDKKDILAGHIPKEILIFCFQFYQSRSREQNKSIDNWKTTTENWTYCSDKVNFHNKQ